MAQQSMISHHPDMPVARSGPGRDGKEAVFLGVALTPFALGLVGLLCLIAAHLDGQAHGPQIGSGCPEGRVPPTGK